MIYRRHSTLKAQFAHITPCSYSIYRTYWRHSRTNYSLYIVKLITSLLYTYYTHSVFILYPYSIHTLSILYPYSIHTLSILYLYSIYNLFIHYICSNKNNTLNIKRNTGHLSTTNALASSLWAVSKITVHSKSH